MPPKRFIRYSTVSGRQQQHVEKDEWNEELRNIITKRRQWAEMQVESKKNKKFNKKEQSRTEQNRTENLIKKYYSCVFIIKSLSYKTICKS